MNTDFEVAIVGGSLSGAALGLSLAKHGIRVLILERDAIFRDRVRGEGMHPWGAAEAEALSILQLLTEGCGRELSYWTRHALASAPLRRDLPGTTPGKRGCVTFYHPAMQERLLRAASEAGVVVWRPAQVVRVAPGQRPELTVHTGGNEQSLRVDLVVGADGRSSRARVWGRFRIQKDPDLLRVAGKISIWTRAPFTPSKNGGRVARCSSFQSAEGASGPTSFRARQRGLRSAAIGMPKRS